MTMRHAKTFYIYMMTNRPRSHVLYTGVTGNLLRRVSGHKSKLEPGFTSRYNLTRLVYYEQLEIPCKAFPAQKKSLFHESGYAATQEWVH
jgi:putative endonuclease